MHLQNLICLRGQGQWVHVINAYCMLPSFTQLALCSSRKGTEELCGIMSSGKKPVCADVAKSVLTHFITSLFPSFFLPLSLCSILEECRRQASRHFCIYFLLLFIHGLAHQQHSWGECICHTNSAPLIYLIPFFHGSLFKKERGGEGNSGTFKILG